MDLSSFIYPINSSFVVTILAGEATKQDRVPNVQVESTRHMIAYVLSKDPNIKELKIDRREPEVWENLHTSYVKRVVVYCTNEVPIEKVFGHSVIDTILSGGKVKYQRNNYLASEGLHSFPSYKTEDTRNVVMYNTC
ncbi:hypothetical protein KP509_01G066700 [Ceratopteris richardii]|uniref:Uncharacterized protein n=1 Tax=Ceratopteris richardii TaxID=49495 RepID=A0A8T2VM45_CERRI|nr:hypothetical protein KP509_01G066700 [Ceratopteris richardii]